MNNPLHQSLPAHVAEFRFHPGRRYRFDFAWPEHMIALEVEGGIWANGHHARPKGILRDIEKYNNAAVLGWRVLRCTPQDLETPKTVAMLRAAMNLP